MSSNGSFFQSTAYKKVMAKVYGLGAAVVIIGCGFKIQHWPGAGVMLITGLGVEALIFGLSAFEPLHSEPDWSLVYPELSGMFDIEDNPKDRKKIDQTSTSELDELLEKAKISPDLISNLGDGLTKLSNTAHNMADISNTTLATANFTNNINNASAQISELNMAIQNDTQANIGFANKLNSIEMNTKDFATHYFKVTSGLATSSENIAELNNSLSQNASLHKNYSQSLSNAISSYDDVIEYNNVLAQQSKKTADVNVRYQKNVDEIQNSIENLSGQLNSMSSQINSITSALNTMKNEMVMQDSSTKLKSEFNVLISNLNSINGVYSNMLKAMNISPNTNN